MPSVIEVSSLPAKTPELVLPDVPRSTPFQTWNPTRTRLTSITILAWSVRFSAMLNLLGFSQLHPPRIVAILAAWVPFEISVGRRILMLLTAVILLVLSSGLERGKRIAWALTIIALVFAPLIHLGREIIGPQILLNLPLIVLLGVNHSYFVAQSDRRALRSALIICPILLLGLMVYGTMRVYDLRHETAGPSGWLDCIQTVIELVLVQNAPGQHALSHQTLLLFSQLRLGGASIALLALFLALRPPCRGATPKHGPHRARSWRRPSARLRPAGR